MYIISDEVPSSKKRAIGSDESPIISDNGIKHINEDEDNMPTPTSKICETASSTNEELPQETTTAGRPKRTRR